MPASDDFDTWREQYEGRANKIAEDHAAEIRALFTDLDLLKEAPPERVDLDALRAEAAQFDRDVAQTYVSAGQVLPPGHRLGWQAALSECDALLTDAFTHGTRALSNRPPAPLIRCASTDKWLAVVGDGLKLRAADIDALRDRVRAAPQPKWVLHVPGTGTLVNSEALEQAAQHTPDQSHKYSITLRELVTERWGRRLITDETAVGRELIQSGAWLRQLRRDWPIEPIDPDDEDPVLAVSALTRAGWPRWVSKYALDYARVEDVMLAPVRFGGEGLAAFLDNAGDAIDDTLQAVLDQPAQVVKAWFLFIVKTLLVRRGAVSSTGLLALKAARRLNPGLDALFTRTFKRRFSDWLAETLFIRLDAAIGPDNIPYAVQMACGIAYDAARFTPAQLRQRIAADPELDIDLRLMLLGSLTDLRHRPVRDIARAARNDLGMSVPPELFEIP